MYMRETHLVNCLYELVRNASSNQVETILAERSDQCRDQELAAPAEFQSDFHRSDIEMSELRTRRRFPQVMLKWREAHPYAD
jgi:hypothetical protein